MLKAQRGITPFWVGARIGYAWPVVISHRAGEYEPGIMTVGVVVTHDSPVRTTYKRAKAWARDMARGGLPTGRDFAGV